jgi:hypothetical protein
MGIFMTASYGGSRNTHWLAAKWREFQFLLFVLGLEPKFDLHVQWYLVGAQ